MTDLPAMPLFTHTTQPMRVVFGVGSSQCLPDELARLGKQRVLVLCTPGQYRRSEALLALLADRVVAVFDQVVQHVPAECIQRARQVAEQVQADGCLALGGGSAIGLAKALARTVALPYIAVPTTYAGSEMTPIWGVTEAGHKQTGRDQRVLASLVVYDPTLTASMPASVAGPSGMNALAHCVEALYAHDGNPLIQLQAEEGIRTLATSLPLVCQNPANLAAQSQALYAAWLAGRVLGSASMGMHHKLCHSLGGSFGLPHAETHSVLLPYVTAYTAPGAPTAMRQIANALGSSTAAGGLYDIAASLGNPLSLHALGMQASDLARAAELATRNPYPHPLPVTLAGVLSVLERAYAGQRPD